MGLQEMMDANKQQLRAENQQLRQESSRLQGWLQEDLQELEAARDSLEKSAEAASMKKRRQLLELAEKHTRCIRELTEKKKDIEARYAAMIRENTRKLTLLDGKAGGRVTFGTAPHSDGSEPLQWAIVGCKGGKMELVCMNTVELMPYGNAEIWVKDKFLEEAFTPQERKAIESAALPTEEKAKVQGDLRASATGALRSYLTQKQWEDGRKYMYNNLQIQNGIKSQLERCDAYWLQTGSTRDGFANYVGRGWSNEGVSGRIGCCAPFGVRPMITVDRLSLL